MGISHYRYPVKLSEEQHRWLEAMVHMSSTPTKHYLVARVLLMSDQGQGEPEATNGQIAEILEINRRTVNWQFRTADARLKLKRLYPVQHPDSWQFVTS